MAACTTQPEDAPSASIDTAGNMSIDTSAIESEASPTVDLSATNEPRSAATESPCRSAAHREHDITRRLRDALRAWWRDRDPDDLRRALESLLLLLGGCSSDIPPDFPGEVCVGSHTLHLVPQPGSCLTFPFDASFALEHTSTGFVASYQGFPVTSLVAPACDGIWCAVSFSLDQHGHGAPAFHTNFVLQLGPIVTGTAHRQDIGATGDDGCPTTYTITAD
jgi:hypothetical protein